MFVCMSSAVTVDFDGWLAMSDPPPRLLQSTSSWMVANDRLWSMLDAGFL